ncbi:acetylxylan esterase [Paenibacillus mesophilus]|uniref:alpha/beta hydrolase family protein n=1 Tax=Paenibacillus mesophilus TaxID=2582849 RepID=UPI00110DB9A8|nr:acetylxylan esterase [Paenibacillus mesophilus]TMV47393.1 acetylxylan esterase [Paenibacillus mesophilus]
MKATDFEQYKLAIYDVKDQLKQHVYGRSAEAFTAGDQARDEIADAGQLERRRAWIRSEFIKSLGGLPPSDTPLRPQITGTVRGDGYGVEKVMFESRRGHYVTANLYIPDGIAAPTAAVLHLCGHNPLGKHGDVYQTVSQHLVRAGLIVLTMDPIGQGERLSYYDRDTKKIEVAASTREHEYAGRQSLPLGDNIARYFVHDAMRAVDYLCTRPEVDPAKIGVTGCSGGGTQTSMMMLCDPRIAAAAPAAFIMNRESYMNAGQAQDAEQIWPGLTKIGFDHEDILMAMAPRPALVLAAEYDFFPIEGTRRTVERAKRYWDMYGGEARLEYFEDACVHGYSPPMAQGAAEFFCKHLLGRRPDCSWEGIRPIAPELLWCTASGQVRGDRDDARAVHEENGDRLAELEAAASALPDAARKERALTWLRERVYGGRKPCPLNPRRVALGKPDDDIAVESVLYWSQTSLFNQGFMFRSAASGESDSPVTIALWARGTRSIEPRLDWIRETCKTGRAVFVLDVSGDGAVMPNSITARSGLHDFFGTIHKLAIDLYWLGDSLAALRTFDVLRALDIVELLSGGTNGDIRLYADGRFGLYGQLAELLDDRLKQVEVANGIGSIAELVRSRHYDMLDSEGIIMPGMLRYFDLPDLRRWK